MNDYVLIYDIETRTFGKPNPKKDRLKIFGCYSYKTEKYYLMTDKEQIQKIINAHKFMVGFNNYNYDNPILEREGIEFKYKTIIDLRKIFRERASSMKIDKGMLGDLLMKYSLDYITKMLDIVKEDGKLDIDYTVFQKDVWTPEELKLINKYTRRDIEVTKKLYDWVEDYFDSFKPFLHQKDVDRKVYLTASIAKFAYKAICKEMGWEETYGDFNTDEESIKGGYVAHPAGERFEGDIFCLDYNSLYPHIIIQCNLYGHKRGSNINDTRPIWHGGNKWKVEGNYYSDELSDVCKLLIRWYKDRVKYKKVGDKREYTIKIIINTIYGILTTPYYDKVFDLVAGGDCTRIGRQWTKYARKRFKESGYENLYTDSVGKDSLIGTNKGKFTIEKLFNSGYIVNYNEKQKSIIRNYKVLSLNDEYDLMYDDIVSIIRHKTHKKIYKITLSNQKVLILTEDHSLIWFDNDGNLISKKPTEINNTIYFDSISDDFTIKKIKKLEEIKYDDYVYDIETRKTQRFFANDVLVHNTDSVYVLDVFKDKEKLMALVKDIIDEIKATTPFSQNTFDMGIDDEIKYMFFFKGGDKSVSIDEDLDSDDFINKPKGFMKKNYIYVTKDDKVIIKNLGVKKKSNSLLSRKIFWDILVPQIKKGNCKFSKLFLKKTIERLLKEDLTLAAMRKEVGAWKQYKDTSPGGIQGQIAKKHGAGIHFMIPITENMGVGKGKHFCTIEEFKTFKLELKHIDLSNVWKELEYFTKPPVIKNIFSFSNETVDTSNEKIDDTKITINKVGLNKFI